MDNNEKIFIIFLKQDMKLIVKGKDKGQAMDNAGIGSKTIIKEIRRLRLKDLLLKNLIFVYKDFGKRKQKRIVS